MSPAEDSVGQNSWLWFGRFLSTANGWFSTILDSEIVMASNQYLLIGEGVENHKSSLKKGMCLIVKGREIYFHNRFLLSLFDWYQCLQLPKFSELLFV